MIDCARPLLLSIGGLRGPEYLGESVDGLKWRATPEHVLQVVANMVLEQLFAAQIMLHRRLRGESVDVSIWRFSAGTSHLGALVLGSPRR